MADWQQRAQISEDVVYFPYVDLSMAQEAPLVFVWDLDKTYLETHFETLKGLIRTALEKAFQKRNVPGTNTLVKALISSYGKTTRPFPIFFITASPPQMESKIKEKLIYDGIQSYGCFFKDNLKNLHIKRFRRLTNHMGYKIQSLLQLRVSLNSQVQQILWGDDSEADAIIYSLYSDICARRISTQELRRILKGLHVENQQIEKIFELQEKVPVADPVQKIYINLAIDTDPEYYLKFGRRLVATYDTFQASLDLYQDGLLSEDQVVRIAQDLVNNYAFTADELLKTANDLIYRQILEVKKVKDLFIFLKESKLFPSHYNIDREIDAKSFAPTSALNSHVDWVPEHIDYLMDYR